MSLINRLSNSLGGLRESVQRFMQGRYGPDNLYRFLLILLLGLTLAGTGAGMAAAPMLSTVLHLAAMGVFVLMLYRFLSKNINARAMENRKYMKLENEVKGFFKLNKTRLRDRKTFRYRRCPHCKTPIRLKNEKGSHTVRCPVCGTEFKVRIIL